MRKVVSVDLSFSRTGLSIFYLDRKEFECRRISVGVPDKSFRGIQTSIRKVFDSLDKVVVDADLLIMEEPFPNSNFSSGLFALDTAVYQRYCKRPITSFNPMTLARIHGKRKYSKSESVALAKSLISILETEGFRNTTDHNICHDEAESFIYCVLGMVHGRLFKDDMITRIVGLNSKFGGK